MKGLNQADKDQFLKFLEEAQLKDTMGCAMGGGAALFRSLLACLTRHGSPRDQVLQPACQQVFF